jgi:hypothetical protein
MAMNDHLPSQASRTPRGSGAMLGFGATLMAAATMRPVSGPRHPQGALALSIERE